MSFRCWTWKNGASHAVNITALNAYEAQKMAARKLGVRMIKVGVKLI